MNELQVSDGVPNFFPAQRAKHLVLNLQHGFSNGTVLNLSLYRKRFERLRPRFENVFNPLSMLPEIQFDRVRLDPGRAESRGGEIMLSHESDDRGLVWWLGYTWSQAKDETPERDIPRSWDQTHTGKAGVSWIWRNWSISATARIHTGWPKTTLSVIADPEDPASPELEASPLYSSRYKTFHTLDGRVSRSIPVKRGDLTLYLDVTNLMDQANPCCTEYSLGITEGVPLLLERQARWLPVLPSLGITWTF